MWQIIAKYAVKIAMWCVENPQVIHDIVDAIHPPTTPSTPPPVK